MRTQRKILFRVDGNATIGLGHFYRSLALALMLKEEFNITFAMIKPERTVIRLLAHHKFDLVRVDSDYKFSTPGDRDPNDELAFDLKHSLVGVSTVVLDGYWFGKSYQKALRKHPVKVAIVEDSGGGNYSADLIINHAPGLNRNNYLLDSKKPMFALGAEFSLLRSGFLEAAQKPTELKTAIQTVLVCFGGSDYYGYSIKLTRWLLNNTRLKVHLVVGGLFKDQQTVDDYEQDYPQRFRLHSDLAEEAMIKLMQECDFGIVPSSGILVECIACRLPVISGTYTDNQRQLYNGFRAHNVFIDADGFEEKRIAEAINGLNINLINQIQYNQQQILDGNATKRYLKCFNILHE